MVVLKFVQLFDVGLGHAGGNDVCLVGCTRKLDFARTVVGALYALAVHVRGDFWQRRYC